MGYSKLSIVIPVFNEIKTINEILKRVLDVKIDLDKEIIIVDDFSTDGTREILRNISQDNIKIIFHEQNGGKGTALRTGFKHVTGDITIIQDADLEYDPNDYPKLLRPIIEGKADVVYGSRFLGQKKLKGMSFSSFVANKFLTAFSNMLTGFSISDMETCYKVIKTSLLKELELESERFGIEPEITAKLAKKKARLVEVPISYHGREHSEGKKINWKDGISAIYHIIKYK